MQKQSNLPSVCIRQIIIKIHGRKKMKAEMFMFDTKQVSRQLLKSWKR